MNRKFSQEDVENEILFLFAIEKRPMHYTEIKELLLSRGVKTSVRTLNKAIKSLGEKFLIARGFTERQYYMEEEGIRYTLKLMIKQAVISIVDRVTLETLFLPLRDLVGNIETDARKIQQQYSSLEAGVVGRMKLRSGEFLKEVFSGLIFEEWKKMREVERSKAGS